MSAKREKRRRMALKREYVDDLRDWALRKPPKILFWRYRKWKTSRPIFNKRAKPKYYKPEHYYILW